MKFVDIVDYVHPSSALKRIAGAHVVDHRNLKEDELRAAVKKVIPQYLHEDTVRASINEAFCHDNSITTRVLSRLMLEDVLLEEIGFGLEVDALEERIFALEQSIVDESNETELSDLAGGKQSEMYENIELYNFILEVAWEHRSTKSPDESNLLRKLRNRLGITHSQHRVLEAKLGKFPKPNNELHTRSEIRDTRKVLQRKGLLFQIKDERKVTYDIIPEELAEVMRVIFNRQMRTDGYRIMLGYKLFRRKDTLRSILKGARVATRKHDLNDELIEKILARVTPYDCLSAFNSEELHDWCMELDLPVSGTKDQKINRLIDYYDTMQIRDTGVADDERRIWFDVYEALACRDRQLLRVEGIIDKDIEIETKFEKATEFLFEKMLNHKPLNQPGTNRSDGLLSFKDMYIMWDNKSKESPGEVDLNSHLKQFHSYMESSSKPVPIFLVIAPDFTVVSESTAIKYASENIGRNIVLITASELKALAEEWSNEINRKKDEPFPLGLLARPGRFRRDAMGSLY